ncbi:MAG: hypothetical protein IKX58_08090 [Clostridia bacterium]|nr:hypothetical protein [Clostridia bacterium]
MKRLVCVLLIMMMLLPLASCTRGSKPDNTAAPTAINGTEQPALTQEAVATHVPDMSFDPETDNNNLNSGYGHTYCAMLETDEVYYLLHNGYLMYYDKGSEDSGFVCPKPECAHDEKYQNADCCANLGAVHFPSLTVYNGRIWWVGQPTYSSLGIYSMALDGTDRKLMHEFPMEEKHCGNNDWFFHRGRLYWALCYNKVETGEPCYRAEVGYMQLDDFEEHVLYEKLSTLHPDPTIRFLGESAYIFMSYDWIEPGEEPDGDVDYEAYLKFWRTNDITQEILRWDPSMSEPETVYLDETARFQFGTRGFYVSPEGGIYFWETELDDPEAVENRVYTSFIRRVTGKNTKETALTLVAEDGMHYYLKSMPTGVIVALHDSYVQGTGYQTDSIWILTLEGDTLYRGELPTAYREKYTGGKHDFDIDGCWATRSELIVGFKETYYDTGKDHGDDQYFDFIKYEITPDGLIEIPLASCRAHYSDEGW